MSNKNASRVPPVASVGVAPTEPSVAHKRYFTAETATLWVVYAFMVAGNGLIEGGRLAGTTSASIAYAVFTWFSPAGYVFSIWSLIYVSLFAWLVVYTRSAPTRSLGFSSASILFIVSSALNVLWLVLWHFNAVAIAFVVILADWLVLVALYRGSRKDATSFLGWAPISLYTAWITVATIANLAILITRVLDGSTFILNAASVVALTAGVLALGYGVKKHYRDIVFPLVFLWALVGVGVHLLDVSVVVAAIVLVMAAAGSVFTLAWRPR